MTGKFHFYLDWRFACFNEHVTGQVAKITFGSMSGAASSGRSTAGGIIARILGRACVIRERLAVSVVARRARIVSEPGAASTWLIIRMPYGHRAQQCASCHHLVLPSARDEK